MNITGYKKHYKAISRGLTKEESKKETLQNTKKIKKLRLAKRDCMTRLKEKQKEAAKERTKKGKRRFKKK